MRLIHSLGVVEVFEYAKEVLTMGLILMKFNDSIHEGDGLRILRYWRCYSWSIKLRGAETMQLKSSLSVSLHIYSTNSWAARTVNVHGRQGKNSACDLHMEHLNRECKTCLLALGANVTPKSVDRIGKCLGEIVKIIVNFDPTMCCSLRVGSSIGPLCV